MARETVAEYTRQELLAELKRTQDSAHGAKAEAILLRCLLDVAEKALTLTVNGCEQALLQVEVSEAGPPDWDALRGAVREGREALARIRSGGKERQEEK